MSLPDGFIARPFAHRGLHGIPGPENSMAAILAAVEGGWGIEIDVQRSADDVAMVFHEDHLRRLTDQLGLSEVDFGKVKERVGKSSYSLQTAGVLTAKEVT